MDERERIRKIYESGLVRDLALQDPHYREELEKLGIDTCCGGGMPLGETAREIGISLEMLLSRLHREPVQSAGIPGGMEKASNALLIDYVLEIYHTTLREQLPNLELLFQRVMLAHGEHAAELSALQEHFLALKDELLSHIDSEETLVFPALRQNEPVPDAKTVIKQLEQEHAFTRTRLRQMRIATSSYRIPGYASASLEILYQGLANLDAGLHDHIYLENNILFPRVLR